MLLWFLFLVTAGIVSVTGHSVPHQNIPLLKHTHWSVKQTRAAFTHSAQASLHFNAPARSWLQDNNQPHNNQPHNNQQHNNQQPQINLPSIFTSINRTPEKKVRSHEGASLHLLQTALPARTEFLVHKSQPGVQTTTVHQHLHQNLHHHNQHQQQQQQAPEVHFIKYRTAAEADYAEKLVRAHYGFPEKGDGVADKLSRDRQQHKGGITAQQLNFPHSAGGNAGKALSGLNADHGPLPVDKNYAINFLPTDIDVVPGSSYLPPARRV